MSSAQNCIRCNKQLPLTARLRKCPSCGYPVRIISPQASAPRRRAWLLLPVALLAIVVVVLVRNSGKTPSTNSPSIPQVPETFVTVAAPDVPESTELGWKLAYDEAGRITNTVNPAGQQTNIHYEEDAKKIVKKVIRELPGGEVVSLGFDGNGQRTTMSDSLGSVAYEYDGLGRLTAVKREGSPEIRYAYDSQDRVSLFRVGDDYSLKYVYDFLGRIEAIETPAGRIGYAYSAKDRTVQRTLPNSVQTKWHHAPSGQLAKIEHTSSNKTLIASFAYEYRPDGLIREVSETSPAGENKIAYEYDNVQRLISVVDSRGRRTSYRYDALGNRLQATEPERTDSASTFDWVGRLVRHRGERCAHDAAGNVIQYVGDKGPVKLTHTAEGQLKSAKTDKTTVNCQYDGEGNLLRRDVDGRATTFVTDPLAETWRPLVASEAGGSQTAYLWDANAPLAEKVNGEWRFFLHNHQDSVRCVVDASGKVVERPDYCPFGRLLTDTGSNLRPGFAGLFYDPQTAFYLTKARAYDPALGRFMQMDPQHRIPLGSQKDLVSYSYCGADPVNFVDRNGAAPTSFDVERRWTVVTPAIPRAVQIHPQIAATLSFLPRSWDEAKGVLNFGNWAGANRAPARGFIIPAEEKGWQQWAMAQRLPRWIDPVDKGAFYHDLRLGRLSAFDPKLNCFSLNDLAVGIIHQQLASDWKAAAGRPDTTIAGRMAANSFASVFQAFANISYVWSSLPSLGGKHTILPGSIAAPSTGGGERKGGTSPPSPFLAAHLTSVAPLSNAEMRAIGTAKSFSALWEVMNGNDNRSKPPAPIGGVSLAGAGNTLAPLGRLRGVSVDGQGRLVLIAEKHPTIELPPVRLDDVVTVFRGVYDNKSPFVSIDPDPKDPNGPTMNIRHSPGTANTYVGWVLFEADRVMKTYSLGKDNLTGEQFRSKISEHDAYLRLLFSGPQNDKNEQLWERFWIVPSSVTHHTAKDGRTALTEVPLKLRTEAMVMRDGKLVTAPKGQSSKSAEFFTRWFTKNYEAIARESRPRTPKGSGMDTDVPVFAELQRLAVIVAVAERLRDQGVPMPGWMRDYPVKPFTFPTTTPATTAEQTVGNAKYSVYGGVTLTAPPDQVRTIESPEAEALAPVVRAAVTDIQAMATVPVGQETLQATALPAPAAVALGANRLNEADLRIPLAAGYDLPFVRAFDSFHAPTDVFGPSWTLDLPRLSKRVGAPAETPGLRRVYYELDSPLGSVNGVFADVKHVAEANGQLLVPAVAGEFLGLADSADLGIPTQLLMFRDGRKWHFDAAGDLVAVEAAPLTLRFHRDKARRLERIDGSCGQAKASIRLEYNPRGFVQKATGSDGQLVTYLYDAGGRLERVVRPTGKIEYKYQGSLVAAVLEDGLPPRRFEYNPGGGLRQEQWGSKTPIVYNVAPGRAGTTIKVSNGTPDVASSSCEYDARFRPIREVLADGSTAAWRYPADGSTETTITPVEGKPWVVTRTADGRQETYQVPGLEPQIAEFDAAGRLTAVRRGKELISSQSWLPNGLLARDSDATAARQFSYAPGGLLAKVRLTPANGDGREGVELGYDAAGRPDKMTDESGAVTQLKYDTAGRPQSVTVPGGEVTFSFDATGRPQSTTTSWGQVESIDYDKSSGQPKRLELKVDGTTAFAEYDRGRPRHIRQFDGGETTLTYPDKPDAPPTAIRTPNDLLLKIEYGEKSRVKRVKCGETLWVEYEVNARGQPTGLRLTAVGR